VLVQVITALVTTRLISPLPPGLGVNVAVGEASA
jgi:hypothetical protein